MSETRLYALRRGAAPVATPQDLRAMEVAASSPDRNYIDAHVAWAVVAVFVGWMALMVGGEMERAAAHKCREVLDDGRRLTAHTLVGAGHGSCTYAAPTSSAGIKKFRRG